MWAVYFNERFFFVDKSMIKLEVTKKHKSTYKHFIEIPKVFIRFSEELFADRDSETKT